MERREAIQRIYFQAQNDGEDGAEVLTALGVTEAEIDAATRPPWFP